MTQHHLTLHEQSGTEDEVVGGEPLLKREYLVVAEAGLFKRGQDWPIGSKILLDTRTADAFMEAGDVEEIEGAEDVPFEMEEDLNE